ncbi:hypothetical protein [Mycolicibacterium sp. CBMA 234]|uniref:hypothetical protein n=1 Tax=Mycolicibacterium sp. CBMA 234 TaxID=1918495 RepID=UPI0012DD8D97|nr:hypothetical protein [Mycolicibacterium sp. CBMA 234]
MPIVATTTPSASEEMAKTLFGAGIRIPPYGTDNCIIIGKLRIHRNANTANIHARESREGNQHNVIHLRQTCTAPLELWLGYP